MFKNVYHVINKYCKYLTYSAFGEKKWNWQLLKVELETDNDFKGKTNILLLFKTL